MTTPERVAILRSAECLSFTIAGKERLRMDAEGHVMVLGEVVTDNKARQVFHALRDMVLEDKAARVAMNARNNALADECMLLKQENKSLHEKLSRAERRAESVASVGSPKIAETGRKGRR